MNLSYTTSSPPLADYLRAHDRLRGLVRVGLWPLVQTFKDPYASLGTILIAWIVIWQARVSLCLMHRRRTRSPAPNSRGRAG